jgi:hypothetical protein
MKSVQIPHCPVKRLDKFYAHDELERLTAGLVLTEFNISAE